MKGKCQFEDEKCRYNHPKNIHQQTTIDNFQCGQCDKIFEWKSELMRHKEKYHSENVKKCYQYEQENCHFGSNCWFIHEDDNSLNEITDTDQKKTSIIHMLQNIENRLNSLEQNM